MPKTYESTSNQSAEKNTMRMLRSDLMKCQQSVQMYKGVLQKMTKAKNGGRKRKTRRRKHRGGAVSMEFEKPEVSNTSSSGAIQGAMHKQKAGNEETAKLNKEFGQGGGGDSGDDVTVPQMGQAGEAGNKTITGGVSQTLQGRADGEYDNDVNIKPEPDGMPGGGRRRRKTKKRRRKRKTKRRKRKRKSKKRRRKRKTKRRRR